ncbi:universal stress protein [Halococcus salifodinae]|uniref:UpsA domain-containing protein n=1 Tax=Halococcus salifodinae DSM 8989 TaxID=1227456 RepID=M0MWV5_9EURY|nr:universal stress protein [Halococcus salifodinae]EMA50046.1 UpsA domain-containing protein [Halococcus salifodinae DSM 8989]
MERALAVVEGTEETKQLVREAGELAAGVDAELFLLHVTTEEEFSDRANTLASIPNYDTEYSVDQARDGARQFAADIGREVFEGLDVEYEAVGALGDKQGPILDVAAERDCDHLFISGRKRSPTGKALFGDLTQSIILEFDGAVTVTTV